MIGRRQNPELMLEEMLPVLHAAVRRNCPDWMRSSVDDLVQEAGIRILEIMRRGEGNRVFSSSYLWRTGYSVVIDEIRRRKRRKEQSLEDDHVAHLEGTGSADPEKRAESGAVGKAVRVCLSGLRDARRRAVVLRLMGHGVREIATLLDWSYKRAENLVRRGMEQLKNCLEERGFHP